MSYVRITSAGIAVGARDAWRCDRRRRRCPRRAGRARAAPPRRPSASTAAVPEPAKSTAAQVGPAPASVTSSSRQRRIISKHSGSRWQRSGITSARRTVGVVLAGPGLSRSTRARPSRLSLGRARACPKTVPQMLRRVRDAGRLRLLGGHLGEDEVRAVAAERPPHRLGDVVGVSQSRHRPVAGGGGQPVEADLARRSSADCRWTHRPRCRTRRARIAGARGRRRGGGCRGS